LDITTTEVLIIGSGVIGSSIAYHLARQGRQVLVVERSKVATRPAASWASAGGVRRQGRYPAEAPLASEAITRWSTLEQELEADLHYRRGGNLLLAESDIEAEQFVTFVHHQHELGFNDIELLDRQQVHDLVPGLNGRVMAGSYSPADGQADPPRTTRAFARAAQRHGAIYWDETPCTALLIQGPKITGAITSRSEVQAERIVLAAGTWSDDIAATIGIRLPIRTRALQMILSTPADSITVQPVLSSVSRSLSLKQLSNGAFFLGGGWLGNPISNRNDYQLRPASIEGNWKTACELLPAVGQQRIATAWCGLEAQSIDNIPFIGTIPGIDNLILALGFSGHGFALAPAIGRSVADHLAGLPTPELNGLSPARIASFHPEQVEAFIAETTTTDYLE
jgi:sarcosine oxidase, subunit beta